jgi:hypothetical protein
MRFENGDLRYIKFGEREVLRRVYAAVRDRNWGTIPATVSLLKLDARERSFHVTFVAEHREREIDFVWRGEITGDEAGAIRFSFDGQARSTFLRNRIGICVLHPAELAGTPCRVRYVNGSQRATSFPELVAAEQPIREIHDLSAIAHEIAPGLWAEVSFSGDSFEMEDQRNWIDASFKTYCTPLRLPFPLEIAAGDRITQSVELRLRGTPQVVASARATSQNVLITRTETRFVLPPIGFGLSEHALTEREVERLAELRPAHLRIDVRPAEDDASETIARSANEASRLGAPLEIALFLGEDAEADLRSLIASFNQHHPRIARWLVFDANAKSSSAQSLRLARRALRSYGAPIGGGANADFYQLNQFRPPAALMDFVAFSMNPQTHAFDDASLVETLTVIPQPARSAKQYFDNLPVVISPVTFKPRFNAVATAAEDEPLPDQLPPQVDPRQMTLFGAAWTIGALKRLAESEVASVTCFETTGWRGVMETEAGSPLPEQFPSTPGAVFPLYHALADVAEFAGGQAVMTRSADPLRVEALLLTRGERQALLLANLTPEPQTATMAGLATARRLRRFTQERLPTATSNPDAFRRLVSPASGSSDDIEMAPYEIVRLDW